MKPFLRSLLCASVGWGMALLLIVFEAIRSFYFSKHAVSGWTFESMIGVYALAIAAFVLPVWLLVLFPLFLFSSSRSFIWGFICCPLLGALLAGSVIFLMMRSGSPQADPTSYMILAAIVGSVTGLCASFVRHSETGKAEPVGSAKPTPPGTSAAEQPRVPGSGAG